MSRPIAESLSLLSETLGNCKNNLKEKEVADVDNIKISDVDEKIAEIPAGGGSGNTFNWIENVSCQSQMTVGSQTINSSCNIQGTTMGDQTAMLGKISFTPKEDNVRIRYDFPKPLTITKKDSSDNISDNSKLEKGIEYIIPRQEMPSAGYIIFCQSEYLYPDDFSKIDTIFYLVHE